MTIEIIIAIIAIPVGFLIAYLANDELVQVRKWFKAVIIASILVGIWFALIGNYSIIWTCGFILIVTFISYWKSYDKKWCRRRN